MKYYFNAIENFRDADYAESIKMFKASLNNKPPARLIDNIYFGIGVSRYQLGQFERAAVSFNRVVEQYSKADKWLISQVMLGLAYFRNGESSRALFILTRARRNTESPTLHRMIDRIMDDLEKETLYAAIK
jgi:TolA-binding protein